MGNVGRLHAARRPRRCRHWQHWRRPIRDILSGCLQAVHNMPGRAKVPVVMGKDLSSRRYETQVRPCIRALPHKKSAAGCQMEVVHPSSESGSGTIPSRARSHVRNGPGSRLGTRTHKPQHYACLREQASPDPIARVDTPAVGTGGEEQGMPADHERQTATGTIDGITEHPFGSRTPLRAA